jgi:hypothetical protein
MASVSTLSLFWPIMVPATVIGSALLVRQLTHVDWLDFFTGPGRISRVLLLLFVVANWKGMPLAWTVSRALPYWPPQPLMHD